MGRAYLAAGAVFDVERRGAHGQVISDTAGLLPLYRFASLAVFPELVHAVATRHGGVSRGPFASLNVSRSVGDAPEDVLVNRQRLCQAVGVPPEELVTAGLVHGTRALPVGPAARGHLMLGTDALVTAASGVPLMLCFADCAPIILYDPVRRVVGLVHAGWRGTLAGAAVAAVQQMAASYGSRPADLRAAIGPAIGPCCYEVGPEVVTRVRAVFSEAAPSLLSDLRGDRAHFNLWEANRRLLLAAGVGQVEVAGLCTVCHRDEFFSHRADNGRTGRFGVVVMLRAPEGNG